MTARKRPLVSAPPMPKPQAIAYPPASIWKDKEQGVTFEFRGNTFARSGAHVTLVPNPAEATSTPKPKVGS